MSDSTLFNEAILEAKKLRELAEANATNALVEAVTPRIRKMIEQQLIGESGDSLDADVVRDKEDDEEEVDVLTDMAHSMMGGPETDIVADEKMVVDLDDFGGGEAVPMPSEFGDDPDVELDDDLVLSTESVKMLMALIESSIEEDRRTEPLVESLGRVKASMQFAKELSESVAAKKADGKSVLSRLVVKILRETKTLQDEVIRIARQDPHSELAALGTEIQRVRKEIVEMASRKQVLKENSEVFEIDLAELGLAEGEMDMDMSEEDEDMDMDMDMGDEDVDDVDFEDDMDDMDDMGEEGDVEIPEDLAQQLLDVLQGAGLEDEEAEDLDMDVEDDMDLDDVEDDDDEVVEIDEAMLKQELARMRAALDEGEGATDPDVLSDFGGASEDREAFVDGDDSDLNVYAKDLGKVSERKLRRQVQKESRQNRALRKQLTGYKKVTSKLREQLEQMNLFNAKLLYVNKLMQNESISRKQLKAIVETVDKAETLREVRLVYKTLTESAGKRRRKSRRMNESRRRSSSSRASRSGGVTKTDQASRWATLAGISNDK